MAKKLVTFQTDTELVAMFDECARSRGLSRTKALERLMRGQIDQDQRKAKSESVEPRFKA